MDAKLIEKIFGKYEELRNSEMAFIAYCLRYEKEALEVAKSNDESAAADAMAQMIARYAASLGGRD